jgi:hypothetical protein
VPLVKPPSRYDGAPSRYLLRRGTPLWRVHQFPRYPASCFNPKHSDRLYGGGRFDATEADQYPFLYAGLSDTTALAERLLRGQEPDDQGYFPVPYKEVAGRRLSFLILDEDLTLVSLVGQADLAAVAQDAWLVTAPGRDYPFTRDWAHWLRRQATWAHGLIWDSARDRGSLALVLFGDRLRRDFGDGYEDTLLIEAPQLAIDLSGSTGVAAVNDRLRRLRAVVAPPSCRDRSVP